jgi:Tol biopolymer transport system component
MKLTRFDYIVFSVMGALLLAITGVVLAGDRVGARVARTFPEAGAEVGAYGQIGIEFAQAMQADTVAPRFSIEPSLPGSFQWSGHQLRFTPSRPFRPGQTYTARLAPGALGRDGRATKQDVVWQFRVRQPQIIYLSSVTGPREVWRLPASGGQPTQLTQTDGKVYDFAVSPDGERIVYTVVNEARGSDLWIVDRDGNGPQKLVECGADVCTVPAWSPTSNRVAFSREPAGLSPGSPPGAPRVWTVDVATGQAAALYQSSEVLGYGPTWSPDGSKLAFFDGSVSSIRLLDINTSQEMLVKTLMGTVGSWSPDGQQMLFNDLNFDDTATKPYASVNLADFSTQSIKPILGREFNWADYSVPAWSPDGAWVAISLRVPESGATKQIWLMRPDGREGRSITNDPNYTFGGYRWNAWGDALVFQRFELNKPFATPEVVVWSMATGEMKVLISDAATPEWLP